MILDSLDNWQQYSTKPAWSQAFAFLQNLPQDAEPGEHVIFEGEGRDVYAVVFDFSSKNLLDTTLEAHRTYVDIHVPLSGPEVHGRFALSELLDKGPYDAEADAMQYHHPDRFNALFTLAPGMFAAYFPQDGHLTQGKTDPRVQTLRKVVVKVRAALLLS